MPDLLIIRHGESEWNVERRWQGWRDAPLTPTGERQARDRAAALTLTGFAPRLIHASDLGRAHRTALIVSEVLGVECRTDQGFRERSGGEWEGSTAVEIEARWPGMRDAWRRGEITAPPGGEEDHHVIGRFDAALAVAVDHGLPALIVTHHGVLRLAATRAGVPVDALIPNLGGYWFDLVDGLLANPVPLDPFLETAEIPATE